MSEKESINVRMGASEVEYAQFQIVPDARKNIQVEKRNIVDLQDLAKQRFPSLQKYQNTISSSRPPPIFRWMYNEIMLPLVDISFKDNSFMSFLLVWETAIYSIFENNNRKGEIIFEEKLNHWKFNAVYPQAQLKDRGYG